MLQPLCMTYRCDVGCCSLYACCTCAIWDVMSSTWTVASSMWAVIASMHDACALFRLLHHLRRLSHAHMSLANHSGVFGSDVLPPLESTCNNCREPRQGTKIGYQDRERKQGTNTEYQDRKPRRGIKTKSGEQTIRKCRDKEKSLPGFRFCFTDKREKVKKVYPVSEMAFQ